MTEIERKFLVLSDDFKQWSRSKARMVQAFLNTDPERTVRIRLIGEIGYLTIKGRSNPEGTTREEWEWEIAAAEAEALIKICEPGIIEKIRYRIAYEGHTFEVDEVLGENKGLVLAEVELNSEDEAISKPDWLGKEVTGDIRYYNSNLSKKPFNLWHDEL